MFNKDKSYYVDIDAIFDYCSVNRNNKDEYRQKEISDNYELDETDKLRLSQKLVHEVITPNDIQIDDTKYDLLKLMIATVLSVEDLDIDESSSFAEKIAFNTLLNKKFIKEL